MTVKTTMHSDITLTKKENHVICACRELLYEIYDSLEVETPERVIVANAVNAIEDFFASYETEADLPF